MTVRSVLERWEDRPSDDVMEYIYQLFVSKYLSLHKMAFDLIERTSTELVLDTQIGSTMYEFLRLNFSMRPRDSKVLMVATYYPGKKEKIEIGRVEIPAQYLQYSAGTPNGPTGGKGWGRGPRPYGYLLGTDNYVGNEFIEREVQGLYDYTKKKYGAPEEKTFEEAVMYSSLSDLTAVAATLSDLYPTGNYGNAVMEHKLLMVIEPSIEHHSGLHGEPKTVVRENFFGYEDNDGHVYAFGLAHCVPWKRGDIHPPYSVTVAITAFIQDAGDEVCDVTTYILDLRSGLYPGYGDVSMYVTQHASQQIPIKNADNTIERMFRTLVLYGENLLTKRP